MEAIGTALTSDLPVCARSANVRSRRKEGDLSLRLQEGTCSEESFFWLSQVAQLTSSINIAAAATDNNNNKTLSCKGRLCPHNPLAFFVSSSSSDWRAVNRWRAKGYLCKPLSGRNFASLANSAGHRRAALRQISLLTLLCSRSGQVHVCALAATAAAAAFNETTGDIGRHLSGGLRADH